MSDEVSAQKKTHFLVRSSICMVQNKSKSEIWSKMAMINGPLLPIL